MKRAILIGLSVVTLSGCMSRQEREAVAARSAAEAGTAACKAQAFKSAVARVRCLNAAIEQNMAAAGASADLARVALAKRMVLAERLDRGQISQAEFDLEMAQTVAGLRSVEQQREVASAAVAAQRQAEYDAHMVRTNQLMNTFQRPRPITCTSHPQFGQVQTTCQ